MKSKMLLTSLNEVNDEYVEDAEAAVASVKRFGWVRRVAVAACILVAVLIAVPALWGKVPEVEPEPTEPTPVEEPADEPVNEADDEPEIEPQASEDRESSSMGGGTIDVSTFYYDSYDELATNVNDPVFEELAASELLQEHDVTYTLAADKTDEGTLNPYQISIYLDKMTRTTNYGFARPFEESPHYEEECPFPKAFDQARDKGILTTYSIDGIEIEKYRQSDAFRAPGAFSGPFRSTGSEYNERININGTWYYVFGSTESETDVLAAALTEIASQQ